MLSKKMTMKKERDFEVAVGLLRHETNFGCRLLISFRKWLALLALSSVYCYSKCFLIFFRAQPQSWI